MIGLALVACSGYFSASPLVREFVAMPFSHSSSSDDEIVFLLELFGVAVSDFSEIGETVDIDNREHVATLA